MKLVCNTRSGGMLAGTSRRIVVNAVAACSPPKAVRPCSQSSVMVKLSAPSPAGCACASSARNPMGVVMENPERKFVRRMAGKRGSLRKRRAYGDAGCKGIVMRLADGFQVSPAVANLPRSNVFKNLYIILSINKL